MFGLSVKIAPARAPRSFFASGSCSSSSSSLAKKSGLSATKGSRRCLSEPLIGAVTFPLYHVRPFHLTRPLRAFSCYSYRFPPNDFSVSLPFPYTPRLLTVSSPLISHFSPTWVQAWTAPEIGSRADMLSRIHPQCHSLWLFSPLRWPGRENRYCSLYLLITSSVRSILMSLLLCMYVRMPTEYRVALLTTIDLMTSTHARSLLRTGTIDNTKREELARIYSVSFVLTKVQLTVCSYSSVMTLLAIRFYVLTLFLHNVLLFIVMKELEFPCSHCLINKSDAKLTS